MDWVLFSLSLVVVKIAIICLAIVFDKKFNQGVKLVDSQCYLEAYNLFDKIAKHKYALIFGYCEKILPYQVLCLLNLSRYQESIVICDRILKKMPEHENNQYKSYIYYFKVSLDSEINRPKINNNQDFDNLRENK